MSLKIFKRIKWYNYWTIQTLKKIHPYIILRLIKRYKNQIVFIDKTDFILDSITYHDLKYATENHGYFFDCHELRQFLSNQDQNDGVAIDIGANLGVVTYLLSKKFNKVIAFEPSDLTFNSLYRNIKLNNLSNVIMEKIACSNKTGISKLYKSNYHGHSSLVERKNLGQQESVKTIRLDEYLNINQITKIEFLKVDVEGHELSVFQGLGEFLNPKIIKNIVFEHIQSTSEYLNESKKLFELLINNGYKLFDLTGNEMSEQKILLSGNMDLLATQEFQHSSN